ncbi:MAG: tetraacyldisaccharide 4'-kinase [Rikenellaceae bacterium]|jgi:tetraacyldisaccharide 4'-kinase|nr:tetraacyldisaccharide 4'-kinase [Rikenellaceae bacterium]
MLRQLVTAPLSWIYGLAVAIRNKLFDWKILPSEEFDIPIVCVGNLTVGGTGKTPHTEYLVEHFCRHYRVAVLSRGYKRKTTGFIEATPQMSYRKIGDEPKQIKLKFPDIPVAVCEKRVEGIRRLRELHPEIDLILLDDAFQHRRVEPWVNVVLMDYNRPIVHDHLLPLGELRDNKKQLKRAHIVIVTKCPETIKPIDMRVRRKELDLYPYQRLYFSRFRQGALVPLFPEHDQPPPKPGAPVIAVAGIGNPKAFFDELKPRFNLLKTITYADHHAYRKSDLERLKIALDELPAGTVVVMTEKDAVKLSNRKKIPVALQKKFYFAPIEVDFLDHGEQGFIRQIDQYVQSNQKYSLLHPE